MRQLNLIPKLVEYIPQFPEEGIIYVSYQYKTSTHLCACGCGEKTVLPFYMWTITAHEDSTVSFDPSIGNYQFACKSHYMIKRNQVQWLP